MREQHTVDIGSLGVTQEDLDTLRQLNGGELDPRRIVQQAVREEMHAWLDASSPSVTTAAVVQVSDEVDASQSNPPAALHHTHTSEEPPSKGEPQ